MKLLLKGATLLVKISPYLIAMLIGLLIGIERERRASGGHKTMGVRSFLLFSLTGALAGNIAAPLVTFALAAFAVLASLLGYWQALRIRPAGQSLSMATEIAAVLTFALGYFANFEPLLSLALGVIMLLFLHNETVLHSFIKKHLYPEEIQAAATLLLLTVGVIPIIPDRAIDPWNILNLRKLAVIIALIAGIQFGSYLLSRIFGHRLGTPLSGFLAGLVSSTAVFISHPRLAKSSPKNRLSIVTSAIFATSASLIQVLILIAAISLPLFVALLLPIVVMAAFTIGIGIIFHLKQNGPYIEHGPHKNPLNILSAIKLGSLIASFVIIIDLVDRFLGDVSAQFAAFLGALFDLHSVSIASAHLFENKTVSLITAAQTVLLAILASMLPKIALTAFLSDRQYRSLMLPITVIFLALSLIAWALAVFWPKIFLWV